MQERYFLKYFGPKYLNYLEERVEILPYTLCVMLHGIKGESYSQLKRDHVVNKAFSPDTALGSLSVIQGDFKFLNTLLALINYDLHVIEQAQPIARSKKTKWLHLRKLPKNELRVIEIDIPKPDGVIVPARLFKGTGSPKRQHTRRGHWSTYHYRDGTTKRKWIGEQLVGNRELGIIEHDYVVKKEQENDQRNNVATSS